MTQSHRYSFTTLRYVHDVVTGEFVNVGVLLREDEVGRVRAQFRKSMGRVKAAFPALNRSAFTAAMKSVERVLELSLRDEEREQKVSDVGAWARAMIPADDSSLSWGPIGSGLTSDAEKTLERLFERLVSRNDVHVVHKNKTDEDVWRPVRKELKGRKIALKLERKVIVGPADKIEFSRAWKNGVWHAFEPISFDLSDEDGIKDKARRWRGHLDAVAEGKHEKIELRFILGAPKNPKLRAAFESATAILQHAPFDPKIFREDQVTELVDEIEDEVRAHGRELMRPANQGIKT